jgi:MYXO-CTERM domain-containing protein
MLLGALGMSTRARADEDADVDDASSIVDDADASDAGPTGLQPTVFDSNLGCSLAPDFPAGSADLAKAMGAMGLATLSAALLRRRRRVVRR